MKIRKQEQKKKIRKVEIETIRLKTRGKQAKVWKEKTHCRERETTTEKKDEIKREQREKGKKKLMENKKKKRRGKRHKAR